jgi:hypothetical protein
MQPFQCHININFNHMHRLYQKDERAPPGNLQNQRYNFFPPHKSNLITSPLSFSSLLSRFKLLNIDIVTVWRGIMVPPTANKRTQVPRIYMNERLTATPKKQDICSRITACFSNYGTRITASCWARGQQGGMQGYLMQSYKIPLYKTSLHSK